MSVGVKVAVITVVPAEPRVTLPWLEMVAVAVVAEENVNDPSIGGADVGDVKLKAVSPIVLERLGKSERVGVALVKVKVTVSLDRASYVESAALVARIKQVPAEAAETVAVAVAFESWHAPALPPDAIANVIAPVPDPPEVVIDKACKLLK